MIKNGRLCTPEWDWDGNKSIDDHLITDESEEVQDRVFEWIRNNIVPRKYVNHDHTSYGLKHRLEHDTGIYLSNNAFKDAMMQCGYMPEDPGALNWKFRFSDRLLKKRSAQECREMMRSFRKR
jgi:hypothetical protein